MCDNYRLDNYWVFEKDSRMEYLKSRIEPLLNRIKHKIRDKLLYEYSYGFKFNPNENIKNIIVTEIHAHTPTIFMYVREKFDISNDLKCKVSFYDFCVQKDLFECQINITIYITPYYESDLHGHFSLYIPHGRAI